jgi:hypothetical protein
VDVARVGTGINPVKTKNADAMRSGSVRILFECCSEIHCCSALFGFMFRFPLRESEKERSNYSSDLKKR